MAALTFVLINAGCEVFKASAVLIRSGFCFKLWFDYLGRYRQEYLFERYRRQLWEEEAIGKCVKSINCVNCDCEFSRGLCHHKQEKKLLKYSNKMNVGSFEVVEGTEANECVQENFDFVDDYYGQIPVQLGTEINTSTFYDYTDPHPVYQNTSLGRIHEGVSYTISGKILLNCERFSINLIIENQHRDIALHINPRLPQNYIVRNCRAKNTWGSEEVASALPFSLRRGSTFTIQILVTEEQYLISVNSHHFAEFRHRLPYKSVACLEVKGDVDDVTFKRSEVLEYPHRLPEAAPKSISEYRENVDPEVVHLAEPAMRPELSLPYYGILSKAFTDGKCLVINGRVKILPHSFYINLQSGQQIWPHPTIAFHFNPRFAKANVGKHVICRNSWFDGKWDAEERSEITADFCPGKFFHLKIICTSSAYEVYLNGKLIADYRFRTAPSEVDTVYIQGDIKLMDVALCSNAEAVSPHVNLYCNPTFTYD